MNFLNRTPFFRLILPLIAGIVAFQYLSLPVWLLVLLFLLSCIVIAVSFTIKKASQQFAFRWLYGSGITISLLTGGYFLTYQHNDNSEFSYVDQPGIFWIELTHAPIEKQKTYKCEVRLLGVFNKKHYHSAEGNAIVYIQKNSMADKLLYGDRLLVRTEFKRPIGKVNPDGFDYAAYLKRKGITATAYLATGTWQPQGHNPAFSLYRQADRSRNQLLNIYRRFSIEGDEFAVLAALTLGFTDDLQPDLMASYSATGAMHILSVSGLHVGIIYVVIAFILSFMDKNRKLRVIRAIAIILFLWIYAFITGLSPSVVRSALMFSLVAAAGAFERKSQIYNTVFMSAFFMLLLNPDYLFDVGFQLSYAAVLSIVFFQRPFSNLVPVNNKLLRWLRDLIAVSVAAQLGTLPVTLYYFQQFPNYFLLTNIVAIPLSSVVIYLAILLLCVNFVPYLSVGIAFLLKWSVWLMNLLIVGIQNLPFAVSAMPLRFDQMLMLFAAVACITIFFYSRKFAALIGGLSLIIAILVISVLIKWQTLHTREFVVYSSSKSLHVNFINCGRNYVLTEDSADLKKIANRFWKTNSIDRPVRVTEQFWFKNGCCMFDGKTILIANENWWKKKSLSGTLHVDYLILGNKLKPKITALLDNVQPAHVVVDNSISEWYTESVKEACLQRNISFYSVKERGAFVMKTTE
jgi:competence protein ComEC